MRARDVMRAEVVSVAPATPVTEVARLLVDRNISAVPVVDSAGRLLGLISEGDLLRRVETGTARRRKRWLELFVQDWQLASEYLRSHGRTAEEVMTTELVAAAPEAPLAEVVDLMERHGVKRIPIVEDGRLVGLITRADLVRALATAPPPADTTATLRDETIRDMLLGELRRQAWSSKSGSDVTVRDGVVHLWGAVGSQEERRALVALARQVPGVTDVQDHTWLPNIQPFE